MLTVCGLEGDLMTTTVLTFVLTLDCGHSKMVHRALDGAMPTNDARVNCQRCTADSGLDTLAMSQIAGVELVSAGTI